MGKKIINSLLQHHDEKGAEFDLLQIWNWSDRGHDRAGIDEQRIDEFLNEQFSSDPVSPLALAYRSLKNRCSKESTPVHQPEAKQFELFKKLLQHMTDRNQWLSHPPGQRALIAYLLMNQTEYTLSNRSELLSLFRSAGFSDHVPDRDVHDQTGLKPGTIAILLRLLHWEDHTIHQFLDVYLLHRIEHPQVLLALLPTDRNSPVISLLADAFEQFIRLHVHHDSSFDAGRYLLRTSIRNPHPAFYEKLHKLTRDHSYEQNGITIPIDSWIEFIRDQVRSKEPLDPVSSRDKLRALLNQYRDSDQPDTTASPVLDRLKKLRGQYAKFLEENADPRDLIDRLRQLIGQPDQGASSGGRTLLSLVKQLHSTHDHLLQSGYPAHSDQTLRDLAGFCNEIDDRLQEFIPRLLPPSLSDIDELEETEDELIVLLAECRKNIGPPLPVFEQHVLDTIIDLITAEIEQWVNSFEELLDAWQEEPEEGEWNRDLSRIFSIVESRFSATLSRDLLKTIWDELWIRIESEATLRVSTPSTELSREDHIPADGWARRRQLLVWGLNVMQEMGEVQKADLIDLFYESWSELLQTAMERGQETRVNTLLHSTYRPLFDREEASALITDVRTWQFDRYCLPRTGTGDRSQETDEQSNTMPPVLAFLTHFSPVWLSLMAGAIFMLDFGEPWTQMARIGDLRGIVITFLVGVGSTYLYLFADLRRKVQPSPEDAPVLFWSRRAVRLFNFLLGCLVYTFVLCSFFWFLLSRTEEVVQGPLALGHIIVWTGFALFVGIFLGLLANQN